MKVLMIGATGRFGSIADLPLERGHEVRARTRIPGSPLAKLLSGQGTEIVGAD